ncbi:MAG: hypothetical protein K2W85_06380 [Phycisphaerales bacterium]|nr:hypothetical protein [Phycisphaerales bacterium]
MDSHDCYELCVQGPRPLAMFLRAVHGREPRALREDFCGTAALSRAWIMAGRSSTKPTSARAVDLDHMVLARARASALAEGIALDTLEGLTLIANDAIRAPVTPEDLCDVIFVGNFSIGYMHDRATLLQYLRRSCERLQISAAHRGIFVCDTYCGPSAFKLGSVTRTHVAPEGRLIRYTWQQKHADALTGMVTCVLHFQVEHDGDVIARFPDAFTYHWRLWSLPELLEAMLEAGFSSTEVYQDLATDPPTPLHDSQNLGESGIVCVVASAP